MNNIDSSAIYTYYYYLLLFYLFAILERIDVVLDCKKKGTSFKSFIWVLQLKTPVSSNTKYKIFTFKWKQCNQNHKIEWFMMKVQ